MLEDLTTDKKVIGIKQSQKAVEDGEAGKAFVALDCEDNVKQPFLNLCRINNVQVVMAESMEQLGQACGISVGAAVAVILL
ncbi:MAG: ribosomal L7Ae/L30e/S12e/Gadd45 family protein [Eubacteriales bacterium]|nr:ribosomal L7Ae/L30e/S12e/Gadd45 family protein [Eubacteriales bacterium]